MLASSHVAQLAATALQSVLPSGPDAEFMAWSDQVVTALRKARDAGSADWANPSSFTVLAQTLLAAEIVLQWEPWAEGQDATALRSIIDQQWANCPIDVRRVIFSL